MVTPRCVIFAANLDFREKNPTYLTDFEALCSVSMLTNKETFMHFFFSGNFFFPGQKQQISVLYICPCFSLTQNMGVHTLFNAAGRVKRKTCGSNLQTLKIKSKTRK